MNPHFRICETVSATRRGGAVGLRLLLRQAPSSSNRNLNQQNTYALKNYPNRNLYCYNPLPRFDGLRR
jgi:hypothetical protein